MKNVEIVSKIDQTLGNKNIWKLKIFQSYSEKMNASMSSEVKPTQSS